MPERVVSAGSNAMWHDVVSVIGFIALAELFTLTLVEMVIDKF